MRTSRLDLSEILGSLSLAEDLANNNPEETALRAAWLASTIARLGGGDEEVRRAACLTTLLRFLGCTSYATEEAVFFTDDMGFKSSFSSADAGNRIDTLQRGFQLGQSVGLPIRIVSRVVLGGGHFFDGLVAAQCETSRILAANLGLSELVCHSLGQLYERWDGSGKPSCLTRTEIELPARIAAVAYTLEVWRSKYGADAGRAEIVRRAGSQFDPEIVTLADRCELPGAGKSVWPGVMEILRPVYGADLKSCAGAFADFADLKSRFTTGHSRRAAVLARGAAAAAEMNHEVLDQIEAAALLMNVGMVSVSNAVLESADPLTRPQRERIEMHTMYTERILRSSPVFEPMLGMAAGHHEKLNGSGYHRGRKDLSLAESLLGAADAFTALTSQRAHRPTMTPVEAGNILSAEVREGKRDRRAVEMILEGAGLKTRRDRGAVDPSGLTDRELEVFRFLGAGLSNKAIGEKLGLSAKTIQHHTSHIYEKLGVSSRAAAVLLGVQKGLFET